jgi:hypothetical protein
MLWGALIASATIASAGARADSMYEDVHVAVAGGEDFVIEGAKKCDCPNGCAMMKWMKSAMAPAVAGGDKDKLAKALKHVASKPVAGMGQWASIATAGATAAEKGDIDGAKASCKNCHKLYQKQYEESKARCGGW